MSRRLKASTETQPQANNSGSGPKRISIDTVLKTIWNKIGELENEIKILKGDTAPVASQKTAPMASQKTAPVASQKTAPVASQNQKITSTQPTLAPETEIKNNITQIKRVIETQEKRIKYLETQFGRFTQDIMKTTGSVKTDMESRYSQLNNFLVELQTTQMVMNDKVLKQFNDVVEKNAEEKFRNATTQVSEEQVAQEQVAEEQVAEEQVSEEQVAQEQVAEEQVAEEQVAQEQVAEEQVAEEQVSEEQLAEEEVVEKMEEQIAKGEEQIAEEVAQEVAEEVVEKVEQQIAEEEEEQKKENITLDVA